MDRNTVIGLFLMGVVTIAFMWFNQPSPEELARRKKTQDSLARVEAMKKEVREQVAAEAEPESQPIPPAVSPKTDSAKIDSLAKLGALGHALSGEEQLYTLENEVVRITLSNKGGVIKNVELKGYQTFDSLPLILLNNPKDKLEYQFVADRKYKTGDLFFETSDAGFFVREDQEKSFSFKLKASDGKYFEQKYSLKGNSYLLDYEVNIVGFEDLIAAKNSYLQMNWFTRINKMEKSIDNERRYTSVYYNYDEDEVENLSESGDDEENLNFYVKWVSFKQQFFNTTLIFKENFNDESFIQVKTNEKAAHVKDLSAKFVLPFQQKEHNHYPMQFYLGPNHYKSLKQLEIGLEKLIPLGWPPLNWVNKFMIIPVFDFLNGFIDNYGIIILLLTIFIKLVLSFFTYKSYVSTAKMRLLKPEIDELKAKHKDPQKLQMEQMKLYNKAGASPLGGCLPMLLQFPFLVAMFYFFPSSIELRQESFLWADDLSSYDSIYDLPFNIPFYGDHISLFTLLMTVSTIIYTKMNSQMSDPTGQMAQMKYIQYLMPVMFLGIFNSFPAGLTYYYFLANIITFLQQFIIRKFIVDEDKLHKQIEANKKKSPKKVSGFQKRLEKMAREAQAQRKKR